MIGVLFLTAVGASTAQAHGGLASPIHGQPSPSAPAPTVTGPIPGFSAATGPTGGGVVAVTQAVLSAFGYQEKEFFISGMATAYQFSAAPGSDGVWKIKASPGSAAAYETRIEVFTPIHRQRFSGKVIAEWNNVSAGFDTLPDLISDHDSIFRDGDAYVAVSAQFVGAEGAKLNDQTRYASLVHPGDSYSYDIFSQAGMAVWEHSSQVLGGLHPVDVIADGESQSATRLTTYIDALAPVFNVYDGYLVHSRGATSSALQQAPGTASVAVGPSSVPTSVPNGNVGLTAAPVPAVVLSRTDLVAPVLYFESQSDVFSPPVGALGYGPATQANAKAFRLWEVAGTAHADDCSVNLCQSDTGDVASAIARFDAMLNPPVTFSVFPPCSAPINTGESGYTLSAAVEQLETWTATGGALGGIPASAPPLFAGQSVGEGSSTQPVLDGNGNVVGGVRSPAVDVPVATLTGVSTSTPSFCFLSGTTIPFSMATLHSLYPSHGTFIAKWTLDVIRLAAQRYLTAADAFDLIHAAAASTVP